MARKQWCMGAGFSFLASGKGRFGLVFAGQKGTEEAEIPSVSASAALGMLGLAPRGAASVRTRGQQCQSHPPPGSLQPPTTAPRGENAQFLSRLFSSGTHFTTRKKQENKKKSQPFDPFPCQKAQCCLPESGAAGYQTKLKPFLLLL